MSDSSYESKSDTGDVQLGDVACVKRVWEVCTINICSHKFSHVLYESYRIASVELFDLSGHCAVTRQQFCEKMYL